MARAGIILTIAALVTGMVGCVGGDGNNGGGSYTLIVDFTTGGIVAVDGLPIPGKAILPYDAGTVVSLNATPSAGYRFVEWTGNATTIDDISAASTTVTMNGDYDITATFEETPTITFAIAGPMTVVGGENHWWGAELARDEINAGSGVNVGGVNHDVKLVQVDTRELSPGPDEDVTDSVTAVQAVIDDVDFVVGGWYYVDVAAYGEVAMNAQKIFMNCGPGRGYLEFNVVTNYDKYKYWFRGAPCSAHFWVTSLFKTAGTIGTVLKNTLVSYGDAVAADYEVLEDGKLRLAILMEEAEWTVDSGFLAVAESYLPSYGFATVGTWLVSGTASNITSELSAIAATKPHIIFTAFAGLVGDVYSVQKTELGIPAITIGINGAGQQKQHWANTEGKCNGEIMLDFWAEGLQNTAETTTFLDAFVAKTGTYPIHSAGTYDAVYHLREAIEVVSAANDWDSIADVIQPDNMDTLIQYLETSSYTGTAGTIAYYPMPAIDSGDGVYALSEAQVRALYPDLETYNVADWLCSASDGPHIAHDLVYGPGYTTGIGSQWQDGHKVGVWPMDFGDEYDAALTDQYGCWNFEYPGTVDVLIPIEGFLAP